MERLPNDFSNFTVVPQYPFNNYTKGYVYIEGGRRICKMYNSSEQTRLSISYARYIYSVYLGRMLFEEETVDHRNDDRMDDRFDNYQILTPSENALKSARFGIPSVLIICPVCIQAFNKSAKDYNPTIVTCCSRSCRSKFSVTPYTEEYRTWVRSIQAPIQIYTIRNDVYFGGYNSHHYNQSGMQLHDRIPEQIYMPSRNSDKEKVDLILPYLGSGCSYKEISQITGIPWYTVRDVCDRNNLRNGG